MIQARIQHIQEKCIEHQFDGYLIRSADDHLSEYVSDHFQMLAAFSGFTGSNGTLLITPEKCILWTDGRYFLQAEKQISPYGIELYKMGVKGYDDLETYVMKHIKRLALDGRYFDASMVQKLKMCTADLDPNVNFMDEIWSERPKRVTTDLFLLSDNLSGEPSNQKLQRVREKMKQEGATEHVVTNLDQIAWLLNARAHDIQSTPVFFSFCLMTMNDCFVYLDRNRTSKEIEDTLQSQGFTLCAYEEFYTDLEGKKFSSVWFDPNTTNAKTAAILEKADKKILKSSPIYGFKAVKNAVEIENTKRVHLLDGLAMTRFMVWLKSNQEEVTEIEAEEKVLEFRKMSDDFIETSFHSISASGEHAAMLHYSSDPQQRNVLKKGELYLLDSGGQYYGGTTDVTRTYAIGEINSEQRKDYTLALISMISLSQAVFLEGARGTTLDVLSRMPLWKQNIDYRSGTGHGVGYMLGVHEGPNGFRWKQVPERDDNAILQPGMITTVEPGVYVDFSHGIRHENMLLCVENKENEYGKFLSFENICFTPFDLDAIDPTLMSADQLQYLNDYHQKIYELYESYFSEEEQKVLRHLTRMIG